MSTKGVEGFFEVFNVVGLFGALNEYVVDIDLHIPTTLVLEDLID